MSSVDYFFTVTIYVDYKWRKYLLFIFECYFLLLCCEIPLDKDKQLLSKNQKLSISL